jgi:hypothetical protein
LPGGGRNAAAFQQHIERGQQVEIETFEAHLPFVDR